MERIIEILCSCDLRKGRMARVEVKEEDRYRLWATGCCLESLDAGGTCERNCGLVLLNNVFHFSDNIQARVGPRWG